MTSDEDFQDEQTFNKHLDRIKVLISGSKTSLKELIKCRRELESMQKDLERMQNKIDTNLKVAAEINEALKKIKQEMKFLNGEFFAVRFEVEDTLKVFQDIEKSFHGFQDCLDNFLVKEETKRLEVKADLKVKLQQKLDEESNQVSKKTKRTKRKINRETDQINEKIEKIKVKKQEKDEVVQHEIKKLETKKAKKRKLERKVDKLESQPSFSATKIIDHNDEVANELKNMSSVGGWQRS